MKRMSALFVSPQEELQGSAASMCFKSSSTASSRRRNLRHQKTLSKLKDFKAMSASANACDESAKSLSDVNLAEPLKMHVFNSFLLFIAILYIFII